MIHDVPGNVRTETGRQLTNTMVYKAKNLQKVIGSSCSWSVIALVKLEEYVSNNILADHWH